MIHVYDYGFQYKLGLGLKARRITQCCIIPSYQVHLQGQTLVHGLAN